MFKIIAKTYKWHNPTLSPFLSLRKPHHLLTKKYNIVDSMKQRHFSQTTQERLNYDVVIVGGGPAGLSCGIKLKQLDSNLSIALIEKGAQLGSHILSGNVLCPVALNELLPDWQREASFKHVPVCAEDFIFLTENNKYYFPRKTLFNDLLNKGNYVISLGSLVRWLGQKSEALGIDVLPGVAGSTLVKNKQGNIIGVKTGAMGLDKDGKKKQNYSEGIIIEAKQTVLAEGCFGSLSEKAIEMFKLREKANSCVQTYGIGFKEVWKVHKSKPGYILHTFGWPLDMSTYGGGYLYHAPENLVYLGLVVGLDYRNPFLNPYKEFQRYKHHPLIRQVLEGGDCLAYGARCLNEGGFQAIPKLSFPGGMLVGCSAGFLNMPKLKGTHYAMKSGMLAAETIVNYLTSSVKKKQSVSLGAELNSYDNKVANSYIWSELYKARNCKPAFSYGGLPGLLAQIGISYGLTNGKEPWTLRTNKRDYEVTQPKLLHKPIQYPQEIPGISFKLLDNLARSGVNHEQNQLSHLQIRQDKKSVPITFSFATMGAPETRFCPAGVYEYVGGENEKRLQINAQNCLHCKACAIKTPKNFIEWTVPEGGGGPNYIDM